MAGVRRWREYLIEGTLLGLFMIAACGFATLLEHPGSPIHRALASGGVRRLLMGLAMGSTAVTLIRSPWGRRSGAHMNPSITLTYLRLGKIAAPDAIGYTAAQFAGAVAGVVVIGGILGMHVAHPAVRYAVTAPGAHGSLLAFGAELAISFVLMTVVLVASNARRLAPYTPFLAGALVATYIALEAPISGMSMNPARSLASALAARHWSDLWIYFTAPPLGMLVAAEVYGRARGVERVFCAKLDHRPGPPCPFRCNYGALLGGADRNATRAAGIRPTGPQPASLGRTR